MRLGRQEGQNTEDLVFQATHRTGHIVNIYLLWNSAALIFSCSQWETTEEF